MPILWLLLPVPSVVDSFAKEINFMKYARIKGGKSNKGEETYLEEPKLVLDCGPSHRPTESELAMIGRYVFPKARLVLRDISSLLHDTVGRALECCCKDHDHVLNLEGQDHFLPMPSPL